MKKIYIVTLAAALSAGCSSSPLRPASNRSTSGQTLAVIGSTAAGAAVGNSVNSRYGAPVGAAIGAGAGMLATRALSDREQQIYDEAYEEGRRQGRLEVLRRENAARALADRATTSSYPGGTTPAGQLTHYEGGVVEGVRFGPRDATSVYLEEPRR